MSRRTKGLTDQQILALADIVETRKEFHTARDEFRLAIEGARKLELSIDTIAGSAGIDRGRLWRYFKGRGSIDPVLAFGQPEVG